MLFAPAQVGPHSRCQKVLVMSMCPPVSANHADGCAHGQLIIFSAPVAHVAFTSNWGEAAVHLPCPAAWSPAQLGPHARPSTPLHTCTDLLSRGRHHLPGLQWGGPSHCRERQLCILPPAAWALRGPRSLPPPVSLPAALICHTSTASLVPGRFTRTLDMPRPSTRQLWRARFARWATCDSRASQMTARTPVPLFACSLVLTHSGIKQPQADNVNMRSDAQEEAC